MSRTTCRKVRAFNALLPLILSESIIAQLADKKKERHMPEYPFKWNGTFQMSLPLTRCTFKVSRAQMGQKDKRTMISRRK